MLFCPCGPNTFTQHFCSNRLVRCIWLYMLIDLKLMHSGRLGFEHWRPWDVLLLYLVEFLRLDTIIIKPNERSCDDVCVVGFWKESCSIRRVKIVLRDLIGVAFPFRISEFGKWFTYVSLIHVHLNGELTKPHKCCHHHDIKEEVERSGGSLWWLSMTIYSLFHPSVGQ